LTTDDLTDVSTHFAFGENWASYAEKIGPAQIDEAVLGVLRLLEPVDVNGKRWLDIGSGSGLHSVAAARLGASEIVAIDIDPDSVRTSQSVLSRFAAGTPWRTERASVLDLSPETLGRFDVIYSWGVLHHTGRMHEALARAAALCADGGAFAFALYRRTWCDWFWRLEKPWYSRASRGGQAAARATYRNAMRLALALRGRSFDDYVRSYRGNRGMDFDHDAHDWLGGWPYESISEAEVSAFMNNLGFTRRKHRVHGARLLGKDPGVFGSGCDEYVYVRATA